MSNNSDGNILYLPDGWAEATLDDIAIWGSGGTPSRKQPNYFQGAIPWFKTGELGDKYIYDSEEKISQEAVDNSSAKIFPKGSVAIAMYGATVGKTSILGIDAATNQACAVAQVNSSYISNEFLYYFLLSIRGELVKVGKGGAQPNISQGILKGWNILVPPTNEQYRIVAKVEEIFSELDKGVEYLKTAQEQLKVYRQSVLKYAFEGKLTKRWRKAHAEAWSSKKSDGRWRKFNYDELVARDKTSLDIFWLRDESLYDLDNPPEPDVLAAEIIENLEAGLNSFREVLNGLGSEDL